MTAISLRRVPGLFRAAVVAAALLAAAGCGDPKYPVRGSVTLEGGQPLEKGLLVFERTEGGPPLTARGDVKPDGQYELSTEKPGDGVPPGKYRICLNPLDTSDVPDEKKVLPFDRKYLNPSSSGLEYEVKAGDNQFDIKLSRQAGKSATAPK